MKNKNDESWIDFDAWEYEFPTHLERPVIVLKYFNNANRPVMFQADIQSVDALVLTFDELRITAAGAIVKLKLLDGSDMNRAANVIDAIYGLKGTVKSFTRDYIFNKPYLIDKRIKKKEPEPEN